MRYLFGDSAPFPLGYNFLATLESFMTAATRIVQLEHESAAASRALEEQAATRVKGMEALDQFHNVVMRAVQDTAQKVQHAHALDYAQRVAEFASRYVDEHRRGTLATNEREIGQLHAENERRAAEQRVALDAFLKAARLHVLATKTALRTTEMGKDARTTMTAVFDHPEGIQSAFGLGTAKVPAWGVPRKVSDFTQGLDLLVGVEKSWLRGTVSPKQVNVDDWLVVQFDLADDALDLVLRRKLLEKDSLSFQLRRIEGVVAGKVFGMDGIPADLGPQDLGHLDRLWQALRLSVRDVLDSKEQLLSITLDGKPIFEAQLVIPLIVRLVSMFAPTVREIARRSPNEFELSLKVETDQGRREEVYLRKEQLTSQLQPLSAQGREIFAPLGLDAWVPSATAAPPPVVPGPPGSNRSLP